MSTKSIDCPYARKSYDDPGQARGLAPTTGELGKTKNVKRDGSAVYELNGGDLRSTPSQGRETL